MLGDLEKGTKGNVLVFNETSTYKTEPKSKGKKKKSHDELKRGIKKEKSKKGKEFPMR